MKIKNLINVAALSLILCSAAFVCAQEEKPQEARPEEAKPAQEEAKPPRQDEAKPPKQNNKEVKPPKPQEEAKPQKQDEMKPARPEAREETSGRNQQREAGQSGSRIPDDKFKSHFGRQHTFVINQVTVVQGQPQFQYSGYSFTLVDAWPAGWAYTDDCYIDYIDGEYFLFDLLHPGVRIAVMVVM